MNPFQQFIELDEYCPCCRKKMTLFMQVKGWGCFMAKEEYPVENYLRESFALEPKVTFIFPPPRKIIFSPFGEPPRNSSYSNYPYGAIPDSSDALELSLDGHRFFLISLSNQMKQKINENPVYLFYVCNPNTVNAKSAKINAYDVCSHKQSSILQLQSTEKQYTLDAKMINDESPLINHETFSFHKNINDLEKTYIVNFNHDKKATNFYYFTATQEQKNNPNYRPTVLHKELPLSNKRPDFSLKNRDALINKFESWVIMS